MRSLYTGNGLLYENYKRGVGAYEDQASLSISISMPTINISISISENDEDELRPLFVEAL